MVRPPVLKEEYRVEAVCILLTEAAATLQARNALDGIRPKDGNIAVELETFRLPSLPPIP